MAQMDEEEGGRMTKLGYVDIELHEKDDKASQRKYLVHGYDDVFWTDDLNDAIKFLKLSLIKMEIEKREVEEFKL